MRPCRLAGPASGMRTFRPETLCSDLDHVAGGVDVGVGGPQVRRRPAGRRRGRARGRPPWPGPARAGRRPRRGRGRPGAGARRRAPRSGLGACTALTPDAGHHPHAVRLELAADLHAELAVHHAMTVGRSSTTVVARPRLRKASAISRPMKPPPTTTARLGFCSVDEAVEPVHVGHGPELEDVGRVGAGQRRHDGVAALGEDELVVGEPGLALGAAHPDPLAGAVDLERLGVDQRPSPRSGRRSPPGVWRRSLERFSMSPEMK